MAAADPQSCARARGVGVLAILAVLLLAACAGQTPPPQPGGEHDGCDDPKEPTWGYQPPKGQDRWRLEPGAGICATGRNQSPLLLDDTVEAALAPLAAPDYRGQTTLIEYLKHDVEVHVTGDNYVTVDGKRFRLGRFHFHTPAESRTALNVVPPMEAHFVHTAEDGEVVVLAVIFEPSTSRNEAIDKIQESMPRRRGCSPFVMPVADLTEDLLPQGRAYWRYSGSLTTPPCTEGLRWLVLQQQVPVLVEQARTFEALTGANARDLQKLWARRILSAGGR